MMGPCHIIIITLYSWQSFFQGSQNTVSSDIEFPFTSPEYGLSNSGLSLFAIHGERDCCYCSSALCMAYEQRTLVSRALATL